jgi:hypothetical protein
VRVVAALVLFLLACACYAHKPSDSYLSFEVREDSLKGRWDLALRDLEYAVGLDDNGDGDITWGELRHNREAVNRYALDHLQLSVDNTICGLSPDAVEVDKHSDGAYAVLHFIATCPALDSHLTIRYTLFFDLDAQHRGLWHMDHNGRSETGIFATDHRSEDIAVTGAPGLLHAFLRYSHEGVRHIWTGYDHVLFLLSLLLPSVLVREGKRWLPVAALRLALVDVIKVVTAFTLAHSVTLSLAVLHVIEVQTRLVESVIALSVMFAAINNLKPLVSEKRWLVAFVFGLMHGLGFASVLTDLGLPSSSRMLALAAFNVGVEGGQLAIVALFVPIAYTLRQTRFYNNVILNLGSLLISLLALVWFLQRGFNLLLFSR